MFSKWNVYAGKKKSTAAAHTQPPHSQMLSRKLILTYEIYDIRFCVCVQSEPLRLFLRLINAHLKAPLRHGILIFYSIHSQTNRAKFFCKFSLEERKKSTKRRLEQANRCKTHDFAISLNTLLKIYGISVIFSWVDWNRY